MTPEETFMHLHEVLYAQWTHVEEYNWDAPDVLDLECSLSGGCTARAALMMARCAAAGIKVEQWWCRMNGVAHTVVIEPDTGLVSDSVLGEMRPRWRRHDLTDWLTWPDALARLSDPDTGTTDV
jgi:hypothetical protein